MKDFDWQRSAVLLMDYQPAILGRLGDARATLIESARAVADKARRSGAMVIYVNVGFREGYPEISERNKRFSAAKKAEMFKPGRDCEPDPEIAPQPGDVTMVKRRFGAFAGNDLEVVLRAKSIETLILLGVSTSGAVLSTVRHAADADYRIVVVRDCCADADVAVHDMLFDKVFPVQADVVMSGELLGT